MLKFFYLYLFFSLSSQLLFSTETIDYEARERLKHVKVKEFLENILTEHKDLDVFKKTLEETKGDLIKKFLIKEEFTINDFNIYVSLSNTLKLDKHVKAIKSFIAGDTYFKNFEKEISCNFLTNKGLQAENEKEKRNAQKKNANPKLDPKKNDSKNLKEPELGASAFNLSDSIKSKIAPYAKEIDFALIEETQAKDFLSYNKKIKDDPRRIQKNNFTEIKNHYDPALDLYEKVAKKIKGQDEPLKNIAAHLVEFVEMIRYQNEKKQNTYEKKYKTLFASDEMLDVHTAFAIEKQNLLLIGKSGSGKTASMQGFCHALGIPFFKGDATRMTSSGYVGEDVNYVLEGLLRSVDYDLSRLINGAVICLDELDKKDEKGVAGSSVQNELLTLLSPTESKRKISILRKGAIAKEDFEIDLNKILFIGAGAFTDLGDHVNCTIEDLMQLGFKEEFLNRFEIIRFNQIKKETFYEILKSEESPIKVRQDFYLNSKLKIDIKFSQESIDYIVQRAMENEGGGVRGLERLVGRIFRSILKDLQEYQGNPIEISKKDIEKKCAIQKKKSTQPSYII